ncbi:hypothetical protein Ddye_027621 [Dipteronia dyeriana]|uniref:Amino acid transporter transmembrane domain-containing protein n=1 Tax=Dipteronia dyeriana TaxID=168575 RepID=A0AAD9WQN9_9ROSI|nr:hypothetical protein Ddye_027621 [Dipteronia dyeriana]
MDAHPLIKSYPDIGELAFGYKGRALVSILMYLELYLVAMEFLILEVDAVGFHTRGWLLNWGGMPTAISLIAFGYCGHAVLPTLYNSMKDRSQFSKVLLVCFVTITVNYGLMAVLGYLMYGDHLKSQVTLNLPLRKLGTKIAIYTTLINSLTKYAVIITPIASDIEELTFQNSRSRSILIRSIIVISTVIVILTVPFFAVQGFGLEVIIIVGILAVGSIVDVVGTYTSLQTIPDIFT